MGKRQKKLFKYASKDQLDKFKDFLINKCEEEYRSSFLNGVEENDNNNNTLLHVAAQNKSLSIISWLLSPDGRACGFANILTRGQHGRNALHSAIASHGNLAICEALVNGCQVENGERAHLVNARTENGETILHVATFHGHLPIVSWILSDTGGRASGFIEVVARTIYGETALHSATAESDLSMCRALVDGCKVENGERQDLLNSVDNGGRNALHLAAFYTIPSIVSWLLSDSEGGGRANGFCSVLARTKDDETALHLAAADQGDLETFLAIVQGSKEENGERSALLHSLDKEWTILHRAAYFGHEPIISWLLSEEGGQSNGVDKDIMVQKLTPRHESALHLAAANGSIGCFDAILAQSSERLRLFLGVNKLGWTIFHCAARGKKSQLVSHILTEYPNEAQIIIDARDCRGMTALHRAIIKGIDEESKREWETWFTRGDNENIVRVLLGGLKTAGELVAGADPNVPLEKGGG